MREKNILSYFWRHQSYSRLPGIHISQKFLLGIQHRLVSRPENIALGIVLFRCYTLYEGSCPRHNNINLDPRFFSKRE